MKLYAKYILYIFYSILIVSIISCTHKKIDYENQIIYTNDYYNDIFNDTLTHDVPSSKGVSNALKKAQQLVRVKWIPLNYIPRFSSNDSFYQPFKEYQGIPYSLVMHTNTYIGLDVSIYTYLTAINNPHSVIYTENVRLAPYNGIQCAPYYGTVCSTAVWYSLGIDIPYFTKFVPTLDFLTEIINAKPNNIKLCDILLSTGHMLMVYDIGRDEYGNIRKVTVFECHSSENIPDTRFNIYSFKDFQQRWQQSSWRLFRYNEIDFNHSYENYDFIAIDSLIANKLIYNKDLCTSRGDKVAYLEGDIVEINILNNKYKQLELYKDNILLTRKDISGILMLFPFLKYGDYKARLISKNSQSDYIFFEVINAEVSFNNKKGTIYFESKNATPQYIDLCNHKQSPRVYYNLSSSDIDLGYKVILPIKEIEDIKFCKVYFRGKYGRVSCKPISII